MNMTRFASLLTNDVTYWIIRSMDIVLCEKQLSDSVQHERYIQIARNREYNKIIFLDAEIIMSILESYETRVRKNNNDYRKYGVMPEIENLINYIKQELEHEEHMSREPLMCVSQFKDYDGTIETNPIETYTKLGVFTCDPVTSGVRVVRKPPHS